jgi:hypothetical protein
MGRLSDTYMKSGGAIAEDFAEVMTCAAHSNFASMQVRENTSKAGKNAMLQFSDCKLGEGSSMAASVEAIGKMNLKCLVCRNRRRYNYGLLNVLPIFLSLSRFCWRHSQGLKFCSSQQSLIACRACLY